LKYKSHAMKTRICAAVIGAVQFTFISSQLAMPAMAVEIVAHRGASYDAPENTLAALELAWEQGADSIEADFHLTSDGRIITIHDRDTRRTTGVDWLVAHRTLAELRTLDAGAWKGEPWKGQRLPTLEEVLGILRPDRRLRLEIKCGPEIVPELKRVLGESAVRPEQVIIISFHESVIAAVKEHLPQYKAMWLYAFKKDDQTGQWTATRTEVVRTARRLKADGLSLQANERVDEKLVEMLRREGLEFHVWTVNDPAVARRMKELGAMSITTDRPAFLRSELGL
jgi:glycerophosphoryl diester phosphodiesterase